jgi:hypothetical protein
MRKKKNQNELETPTRVQILKKHYEDLYEKHKAILTELTLSDYSKDIRARILREFGAEVQELITLCNNDGSYEAKQIVNLCRNMESTLECVNAHPAKYEGVPVSNILYEHQADENDLDGNARENGSGHHESHHSHEYEEHLEEQKEHDEQNHAHEHGFRDIIKVLHDVLTPEDKLLIKKAHLDPREFTTHSAVEAFKKSSEYARIAHILEGKSRSRH